MLGNHQIFFLGNIVGSLKNADLAMAYFYLPNRIDWSVQAFQTARYLYGSGNYYDSLYLFREYGGGLSASYPFDRYNRVDASLSYVVVSQENLDAPGVSLQSRPVLLPSIEYVHDNSLWGMWSPVKGSRYELRLFGSPGITSNSIQFASMTADFRSYYKLGDEYSFALRGAGGGSVGKNPQGFFIGGTENWINRVFENGHLPYQSATDFAFLTPALPLRGYNYNARIGTKFFLGNAELRFPLVKYFFGGILPYILQMMNGVMFVDIGAALNDPKSFKSFTRDVKGNLVYGDLLIGTGFGMRMWFLGFPLKFDVGWPYNGAGFGQPIYYFSLGADF
jgi:outer membrane protein assembly factor BamA